LFKNVGRTLALLRELRGKSQAETASNAGIGNSQLSKYETGKELPRLDTLEKLLAILDVGSFEFFYTVHLLDQRIVSLGVLPNDMDSASLAVWATGGLSHLSPETEEAFGAVFSLLLRLYRQVFETVVRGTSPPLVMEASVTHPEEKDG
jgi:transcriptional regulator with XRE-family HTH domain